MMNMLERMGMVTKVEQPVKEETLPQDAAPSVEVSVSAREQAPAPAAAEMAGSAFSENSYSRQQAAPPVRDSVYERQVPSAQEATQAPVYNSYEQSSSASAFWDGAPSVSPDTDRFLEIEELYRSFGMPTSGTNTIYLIEEYLKTLPDSLPAESRRSIILRLISTSGFDFDRLLGDGIDRVSKLNEYAANFAAHTDEITAKNNAEIDALERQIARIRDTINDRKNLHKRQFLAIESEAQRLKQVLDFITK